MRRIRYSVAMSLDGFIAGPKGESDWIVMDPEIDFGALFAQFDTILMGRKTFEQSRNGSGGGNAPLLFESLGEIRGLEDGQFGKLVDQLSNVSHLILLCGASAPCVVRY